MWLKQRWVYTAIGRSTSWLSQRASRLTARTGRGSGAGASQKGGSIGYQGGGRRRGRGSSGWFHRGGKRDALPMLARTTDWSGAHWKAFLL